MSGCITHHVARGLRPPRRSPFIPIAALATLLAASPAQAGCMDTDNVLFLSSDTRPIYDTLMGLMACQVDSDAATGVQVDAVACNYFVAKGLSVLYGVSDFTPENNAGRWPNANEIVAFVKAHPGLWTRLGPATDQATLDEATRGPEQGQPTIAVLQAEPNGHVAIILPGTPRRSTTWNLNVPNSAAFSLNHVDRAYVFCRLSAAFSDPSKVEVYFRVKAR